MRTASVLLVTALLALAGCGGDDESDGSKPKEKSGEAMKEKGGKKPGAAAEQPSGAVDKPGGTEVILDDSEFGTMLYGKDKQAIYIFEKDAKGESNCYDDCATAWPPVFTKGDPKAGNGVKQDLLGTTKRRDGKLQVTYADQPLYYYANEEPGEVRCHNVNLNGGLWWVVGPDGKQRP